MAPSALQQRRTHNTLLFQKLLNLRDGASPFTLVLDTLEQGGICVLKEFVRRAKISKSRIMFISYATLRTKLSFEPDIFITARSKPLSALRTEILSHLPLPPSATNTSPTIITPKETLIIIDTLTNLATTHPAHLPAFLSSLLTSPATSLLAILHTDIPLPRPRPPYAADALTTLTYLATAILTVSSFAHVLQRKRARDRSVQEPVFGLWEKREGVLVGMRGEGETGGVVVRMEVRRRSGRGVLEDFVLLPPSPPPSPLSSPPLPQIQPPNLNTKDKLSTVLLLDEHPLYTSTPLISQSTQSTTNPNAATEGETDDVETTFSLGLTDKQKRDREAVVLPYFDAQKEGGGNMEGGRILYDMGAEDREDFDDEEDEI
ncbi:Elongator complex protein [Lachnellula occidentalis]|uniref:Elongator complex protein 5 n=1 Tax=Lachnellula occidentalis TaxID=215460 RepID=A0A8H8RJN0_9HELO|nr:Elongator complex protein [Lachnellula occidentalis]